MTTSRTATVLSVIGGLFCLYLAVTFLFTPETAAAGFGLPAWPEGDAAAFLNVKGGRDLGMAAVILGLLAAKQRYALGIAMLAMTLSPVCDMLTVLRYDGSTAAAFGMHGLAAALVGLTGFLLVREHRTATTASSPAAALV